MEYHIKAGAAGTIPPLQAKSVFNAVVFKIFKLGPTSKHIVLGEGGGAFQDFLEK